MQRNKMSSALLPLRLCLAVCILAIVSSQPRTPTVMADAYAFIHETLSVPRRDASDIVTDELLHLIELLSSSTPASLDDSSGQQINTQRLFPLHSQTLMNVSSACRNDSLALIEAFLQRQYWAITGEMLAAYVNIRLVLCRSCHFFILKLG